MTDRLTDLLQHTADQLAAGQQAPALHADGAAVGGPAGRKWLLPAAAAVAVVAVAAGAALLRLPGTSGQVYAGAEPELGTSMVPVDVRGTSMLERTARQPGRPQGPADLLAELDNRKGRGVLVAQTFDNGMICATFGYLPPAINMGGGSNCSDPDNEGPPFSRAPLTFEGFGPGGSPGGIKDPAVIFGGAPQGTRTIALSGDGREPLEVAARDAGERYGHRAYFAATWDLGDGPTTVRALDARRRELARVDRPGPKRNPAWEAEQCSTNRNVLQGHFGRATRVGETWARTHPETRDDKRLRYPPSGPMDDATAIARFDYALTQLDKMGPEETYDYRLAANVVLIEADCFPGREVQQAAQRFKDRSG